MMQIVLIGLGAGAAAALLFASVVSGSLLSVLLFYLAPLPILIAAIGWSHWAALIAAVSAALGLAAAFGGFFFLAFLIGIGLPAWWLGYLALLARPLPEPPGAQEWYPAGRLVIWAAIFGALIVVATIPSFGLTEESFRAGLRASLERLIQVQGRETGDIPGVDTKRFIDFLVVVMPLGIAVISTVINLVNLWLAGRIVKTSGRLRRPWPNLPAMQFSPRTPILLAVVVAGSFLPGLVGTVASVFTASLLTAYAVLGFAVLHAITLGMTMRPLLLGLTYAASTAVYWVALVMALFGLADSIFDIRKRVAGKRKPPALPPQ
jgi:hypothetical protein